MSRQTLRDSIEIVNKDMQNAENEVKAVNAAAEYMTIANEKGEEKLDNKEIAEELNKEYKTDLKEDDIEKIEKVVEAEREGNIESVGWDKENNDINMDKINDIYENNKDVFKEENNIQNENKIETNETNEEKEGLLDKAKEALANKFEELQQAAQEVDLHSALRNSDNAFDRAQAEFFDQIDQFTQELHNNKKEQAIEDKSEEKTIEIPLKNNENENNSSSNFKEDENKNLNDKETNNNDKDLNENMQKNNKELDNYVNQNNNQNNEKEEGISKETQEKLEQKAEQAQEKEQNQSEKSEKIEKEAEAEMSH